MKDNILPSFIQKGSGRNKRSMDEASDDVRNVVYRQRTLELINKIEKAHKDAANSKLKFGDL